MIWEHRSMKVAVGEPDARSRFAPVGWHEFEVNPAGETAPAGSAVSVEFSQMVGGMAPAGLLGGEFIPTEAGVTLVEVAHSGELDLAAARTCPGTIRDDYVPGIASEFVAYVEKGMQTVPTAAPWLQGIYRISMGGGDPVDSSPIVFLRLGGLLRIALSAAALGDELPEGTLQRLAEDWEEWDPHR